MPPGPGSSRAAPARRPPARFDPFRPARRLIGPSSQGRSRCRGSGRGRSSSRTGGEARVARVAPGGRSTAATSCQPARPVFRIQARPPPPPPAPAAPAGASTRFRQSSRRRCCRRNSGEVHGRQLGRLGGGGAPGDHPRKPGSPAPAARAAGRGDAKQRAAGWTRAEVDPGVADAAHATGQGQAPHPALRAREPVAQLRRSRFTPNSTLSPPPAPARPTARRAAKRSGRAKARPRIGLPPEGAVRGHRQAAPNGAPGRPRQRRQSSTLLTPMAGQAIQGLGPGNSGRRATGHEVAGRGPSAVRASISRPARARSWAPAAVGPPPAPHPSPSRRALADLRQQAAPGRRTAANSRRSPAARAVGGAGLTSAVALQGQVAIPSSAAASRRALRAARPGRAPGRRPRHTHPRRDADCRAAGVAARTPGGCPRCTRRRARRQAAGKDLQARSGVQGRATA